MKRVLTRRQVLAGTAVGLTATALQAQPPKPTAALPRRILGSTGVSVPILGFGSGSRFTNFYTDDAGEAAVRQALDMGITYLDTAAGYGNGRSETIYGRVLKTRRAEVFLATKNAVRDTDQALRVFEQSLKRLQTDHVDLLHIHNLASEEDLARLEAKGGVIEAFYKLREQKVVRALGMTAHANPYPLKLAIERHDLDCVQMALNAALVGVVKYEGGYKPDPAAPRSFETVALPAARKKNLGILAMKVFGQGHLVGDGSDTVSAETLLRYALSLPIAVAVVGMQDTAMIPQNAAWARTFTPMTEEEMKALSGRLSAAHKVAMDRFLAHHEDVC